MATPLTERFKDKISSESEPLPNPLVLLDDVRLGFEVWAADKGLTITDKDPLEERMFWSYIGQMYYGYLSQHYPYVVRVDGIKASKSLASLASSICKEQHLLPVFIDSCVCREHELWNKSRLDLCRYTNRNGDELGLGPRPGTSEIPK